MYSIKDVNVTRTTEYNGTPCAEVEVTTLGHEDPSLLVYVARNAEGTDFEIVRMIKNESDIVMDWYNNNLHNAYEEIAEENFGDEGELDAALQREEFRHSLLGTHGLFAQLELSLPTKD
ncbi:hypothetical protein J2Z69_001471 [Paenibacillus shirakamiensis]|uniref:Uncharacterized protein n=1 Tax=Paenibacillus shirakamiensis TaxID=1265935 RepID=A0ABS4JHC0_9BACL|nr:hypothetical protein [Paenibacillus shirakamiensis]MBP2000440.1 hypothetical protein [Paenibacillus shirakamiensis]